MMIGGAMPKLVPDTKLVPLVDKETKKVVGSARKSDVVRAHSAVYGNYYAMISVESAWVKADIEDDRILVDFSKNPR